MSTVHSGTIFLIGLLANVRALDYILKIDEDGAVPCPGKDNIFLDKFLDLSKVNWTQIDDETVNVDGEAIFLKELPPVMHMKMHILKQSGPRWIETGFKIDRPDVCKTFYDRNEIWFGFVKDFNAKSKICPPKPGIKYEFNNKKLLTLLKDLAPNMDGFYRSILTLAHKEKTIFCMTVDGDLERKY